MGYRLLISKWQIGCAGICTRGSFVDAGGEAGVDFFGVERCGGLGVGRVTVAPLSSPISGTQPADGCGP